MLSAYNEHIFWGETELFVVWEGYTPPHVPGGHINEVLLIPFPPGNASTGPTSAIQAGPVPRKRISLDCIAEDQQEYDDMHDDWVSQTVRTLTMHNGSQKDMMIKTLSEPRYTYYNLIHYTLTLIEVDQEEEAEEQ